MKKEEMFKTLLESNEQGLISTDFFEFIKNNGMEEFFKQYQLRNTKEALTFLEDSNEDEFSVCQHCSTYIEPLDIPLCEEHKRNYDLKRFWMQHDLELGEWFEPFQFNEEDKIKSKYLLNIIKPNLQGEYLVNNILIKKEELEVFREKFKTYIELNNISDDSLCLIIYDIKKIMFN